MEAMTVYFQDADDRLVSSFFSDYGDHVEVPLLSPFLLTISKSC
jgi:hypothetical protein